MVSSVSGEWNSGCYRNKVLELGWEKIGKDYIKDSKVGKRK